jgi:hypothetical protein
VQCPESGDVLAARAAFVEAVEEAGILAEL